MNHILEVSGFPDGGARGLENAAAAPRLRPRFPWERYIRCLMLCAVIGTVGYMAWRPALLRFSQLVFMVSPSHGDSLAWKPESEDVPLRLAPRRHTPEPAEWRLTSGTRGGWRAEQSGVGNRPPWRGEVSPPSRWRRLSGNPWNWRDDAETKKKREDAGQPSQKPATAFRAKATDIWGSERPAATPAPLETAGGDGATETKDGETPPEAAAEPSAYRPVAPRDIPPVSPLAESATPATESIEVPPPVAEQAKATEELTPLGLPSLPSMNGGGLSELPPLLLDSMNVERREAVPPQVPALPDPEEKMPGERPGIVSLPPLDPEAPETPAALRPPGTNAPEPAAPSPAAPAPTPAQPAAPAVSDPTDSPAWRDWLNSLETTAVHPTPPAAPEPAAAVIPFAAAEDNPLAQISHGEVIVSAPVSQTAASVPETVDWKDHEINAPIPGAYLTIYPRLKFIGLCVPGQGYIRKYNQVAVPREASGRKMSAADGRTPYGQYYIASRSRGEQGPRMDLSWPSPEDAARIGLDAVQTAMVETAWLNQTLPPQNTPAGGGVALTGLRGWLENTDGGFALEEPHMEEIYTALPDGAWVFIQE